MTTSLSRVAFAVIAALAVLMGACGENAATTSSTAPVDASSDTRTSTTTTSRAPATTTSPDATEESNDEAAQEHDEPHPRLAMIEADTGMIQVLDVESGDIVSTLESAVDAVSPGEAPSTSEDGRFVFFSHYGQDHVTIVDTGTWTSGHGTHNHYYTSEPAVVGILDGPGPSHVVNHDDVVAAFFDGEARVDVLDEEALADHRIELVGTFTAVGPHHGVAVPAEGCFVSSLPDDVSGETASSIGVFCDGNLEAELAECPDLHGEAMLADSLVFACADGLRQLTFADDQWSSTDVAYSDSVDDEDLFGASAPRAWGFQGADGVPYLISWAGSTHVYVYDEEEGVGRVRAISLPSPFEVYGLAVVPGTTTALVLTTDGVLHRIDLTDVTIADSIAVVDPFEPDLTFATPHHYVVATGDRAFVLDPPSQTVIEISLDETLTEGRVFELSEPIAQMALAPG